MRRIGSGSVAALAVFLILMTAWSASAQSADETRTVFAIGNINGAFTFPIRAYNVNADQLILAHTWYPIVRDGGPVGLGVDPINERLFVTYEFSGVMDIFDATDATPLGQISLPSTSDLCGATVNQRDGILYVVDRAVKTVHEFDTDTFAPITTWDLPTGIGAWDLEYVEPLDALFVTDTSQTIRWYDINTHAEIGSASETATGAAVSLGVYLKDNNAPVLFTGTVNQHGLPNSSNFVKIDTETGQVSTLNVGGNVRGIAVNQQLGYVYVSVGASGFQTASVRVIDVDSFTELSRQDFPASFIPWSPTDVESTWLAFGSAVKKESSSHPAGEANAGEQITFDISIENRYSRPIHVMPVQDDYDPTQLTFVSADPAPDNVDTVNGLVEWNNMIPDLGHDLAYQEIYTFQVVFEATPQDCTSYADGTNIALMTGAEDDRGTLLDDASGSFAYRIWCTCVTDEDCDDGLWCNGLESCVDRVCVPGMNPCPIDDGEFCNGEETVVCIEETQECGHAGSPCADDGNMCNGEETCDEESQSCASTGENPCTDDGAFCNGDEFCDPMAVECQHSGDPCETGEICSEDTDECVVPQDDPDLTKDPSGNKDPQAGWPEGDVTGGCCGCGDNGKDE